MNEYPNLAMGPAAKAARFAEEIAATPWRWVLGRKVYVPEDDAPFIISHRKQGDVRRKGELRTCAECRREFFWSGGARRDQAHCSHRCAGGKIQRTKHAKSVARGGPKRDTLDKWFSTIVRSVGVCANCGATDRLQCAHIVSRRYLGIRFSADNAVCLCAACHMRFTYRPLEWEAWVIDRMGDDAYWALKRRALSFRGPLDRQEVAARLYAEAQARGLTIKGLAPGHLGWTGLGDTV